MTAKSKAHTARATKRADRTAEREAREDGRCLEQLQRWLRVADQLPDAERRSGLQSAADSIVLAAMLSLIAVMEGEKIRAKLRKDPRLLTSVLSVLIRFQASLQKPARFSEKTLQALTKEGNDTVTERLQLM